MIAGVTGTVHAVFEGRIHLSMGPVLLEVHLPRLASEKMKKGSVVDLHTQLVLEGSSATGRLTPVLIGFETRSEMGFFDLLTTIKGMGHRKALRALAAPVDQIARAIERGDERTLKALPEIGVTMAKRIVVELKGKVREFLGAESIPVAPGGQEDEVYLDALDVLLQLGYKRIDAERMVSRGLQDAGEPVTSPDELVRRALRSGESGLARRGEPGSDGKARI